MPVNAEAPAFFAVVKMQVGRIAIQQLAGECVASERHAHLVSHGPLRLRRHVHYERIEVGQIVDYARNLLPAPHGRLAFFRSSAPSPSAKPIDHYHTSVKPGRHAGPATRPLRFFPPSKPAGFGLSALAGCAGRSSGCTAPSRTSIPCSFDEDHQERDRAQDQAGADGRQDHLGDRDHDPEAGVGHPVADRAAAWMPA